MILRSLFVCCLLSFVSTSALLAQAPKPAKPAAPSPFTVQERIYQKALSLNDLETATGAVHTLLALRPDLTNWNDTLCLLYHGRSMFTQSWALSSEILKKRSDDLTFIEVHAQALEGLGQYAEAIKDYEVLVNKAPQPVFRYKAAALQYLLKRYGECEANLNFLISNNAIDKEKVPLQGEAGSGTFQNVPLRAAVYNIKGILAIDMNKPDEAEAAFTEALRLFPEFIMARVNRERLHQPAPTN